MRLLSLIAGVVAATTAAVLGAAVFWFHVSFTPVLSGSMRPTFDPGSLILTRQVATSAVRPGDVIVIVPPGESSSYAHRVQTVTGPAGHPVVTTKGDANPAPDPWKAQLLSTHTTEVIGSVPKLGLLIVTLHHRGWRVLFLAFAGLVLAVAGFRAIAESPPARRPGYTHVGPKRPRGSRPAHRRATA
jgi:signal peptidase I